MTTNHLNVIGVENASSSLVRTTNKLCTYVVVVANGLAMAEAPVRNRIGALQINYALLPRAWSNRTVCKTAGRNTHVGSNPTECLSEFNAALFIFICELIRNISSNIEGMNSDKTQID